MNLPERFKDYLASEQLLKQGDSLLLAVSGGLDSVVLCHLCRQAGYRFAIAHCNFQLRGEESLRDETFVQNLAAEYGVPFFIQRFDTNAYAQANKQSVQVAARELRYQWFDTLLNDKESGLSFLLTAHHLDDSIETSLMNFFKGTGIAGLRGIVPRRGRIVRPLLFARKQELEAYAKSNHLAWVEDSSNAADKYTRNFFRHRILPLVKEMYPGADANLAANLQRFRDVEALYRQAFETLKKKTLEYHGDEVHMAVLKLKKMEGLRGFLFELLRDAGFSASQTDEVIALLDSDTGKYVSSPTHRIIRNRSWLVLAPVSNAASGIIVVEAPGSLDFEGGTVEISTGAGQVPADDRLTAVLDAGETAFPFLLRPWKTGDYFYPLGMMKKKKLSRFLIDQKMSKTEKEKIWVIEKDRRIVWVVGQRIDHRFRVTEKTRQQLMIRFKPVSK